MIGYLWWVLSSVMTAASVTSLPVPAVVGTAIRQGGLRCTRRRPPIELTLFFGCATRAPTALAQSMAEPPPKPTMAWQPWSR